jgi:hypothetical protein
MLRAFATEEGWPMSISIDFVLEKLVVGDETRSHPSNFEVMLLPLESHSASSYSASLRSSSSPCVAFGFTVFDLVDIFSLEMMRGFVGGLE